MGRVATQLFGRCAVNRLFDCGLHRVQEAANPAQRRAVRVRIVPRSVTISLPARARDWRLWSCKPEVVVRSGRMCSRWSAATASTRRTRR